MLYFIHDDFFPDDNDKYCLENLCEDEYGDNYLFNNDYDENRDDPKNVYSLFDIKTMHKIKRERINFGLAFPTINQDTLYDNKCLLLLQLISPDAAPHKLKPFHYRKLNNAPNITVKNDILSEGSERKSHPTSSDLFLSNL